MTRLRCFAGLPLSPGLRDAVAASHSALVRFDERWLHEKWTAPENLHVTVKFFGSLEQHELSEMTEALKITVREHASFTLPLAGLRPVPSPKRCRMLWASFLDTEGSCSRLASAVEQTAHAFGVPVEERPFTPHATVCRARRPQPVEALALTEGNEALAATYISMSVPFVTVYTSELTPKGPIYREFDICKLKDAT